MATRVQISRDETVALASAPGQRLRADAAAAFDRLSKAYRSRYAADLRLTDSFRPLEVQIALLQRNYTTSPSFSTAGYTHANGGIRDWGGKRWYRRPGFATAATPGRSNHGSGIAVDISGTGGFGGTVYRRLAAMAPAYGWTNDEGRAISESWHWTYTAGADRHAGPATARAADADRPQEARRKPHHVGTVSRARRGHAGSRWRASLWQRFLCTQGFQLTVDGDFGTKTHDATTAYQRARGLEADGVVGRKTWYSAVLGTKAGTRGVAVEIAQRVLGLSGPHVDGVAGPVFDRRARELQRWLGVTPDGVLGPRSVAALIRNG
jgi:peptidoglycan hydrolase-like protein with peptidoglycan-binding domain